MIRPARRVVFWGVGLGCVAAAPSAAALDLAHAVQLSLDGTLFSYESQSFSSSAVAPALGAAPNSYQTTSRFSLLSAGFGLGAGYAVSEHVLLGAQFQLSHVKAETGDSMQVFDDASQSSISLLPRAEYIFDGQTARPYLAAIAGIESTSSSVTGGDLSLPSDTQFRYGAAFGLHTFLNDNLSVDPALTVLGETGTFHSDGIALPSSGVLVMGTVALSVWLGTSKPRLSEAFVAREPSFVPESGSAPEPSPEPSPEPESVPVPESVPPLAVQVGLAGGRELDLQVARDPKLPSILVRLYEAQTDTQLSNCTAIRVLDPQAPIELNMISIGDQPVGNLARHFVVGVLPLHALDVLAKTSANLGVCQNEWPLTPDAREKIQDFMAQRRTLNGDPPELGGVPPAPSVAPAPAPPAPAPPETLFPAPPASKPAPPASKPTPPASKPAPAPSTPPATAAPTPPAQPAQPAKPQAPPSAAFPDAPPAR